MPHLELVQVGLDGPPALALLALALQLPVLHRVQCLYDNPCQSASIPTATVLPGNNELGGDSTARVKLSTAHLSAYQLPISQKRLLQTSIPLAAVRPKVPLP